MTQVLEQDSASPDLSWANGDDFPPSELETPPNDKTDWVHPPENACRGCGEQVIREPGSRGRLPKYHPECKPQRTSGGNNAGPRTVRVSSKDRLAAEEVEAAVESVRRGLQKAVLLASLADPYDALVLHVNSPEIVENIRPILMRWPWLRAQATNASAGAAIFGLAVCLFTTALPILAHHGLIPKKKLSQILVNVPMFMLKLQQRMADSENVGETLLSQVAEQQRMNMEARMRAQTAEDSVNASAR